MGFLGSLFGGDAQNHAYDAINAGQVALSPQIAAQQQQLAGQLQQQASGNGPSVAKQLMQQNLAGALANNNAMAASTRGNTNPALAARQAMQANASATQNAAAQGALGQAGEAMNAQGQLGGELNTMASQNLGAQQANQQAGLAAQEATSKNGQQQGKDQGSFITGLAGMGAKLFGLSEGGHVDGQPAVSGDSPKNDTVPAMLSPGEIVIKKTAAQDPERAHEFLDHVLKESGKKKGAGGYSDVVAANQKLEARVKALEAHMKGKKS